MRRDAAANSGRLRGARPLDSPGCGRLNYVRRVAREVQERLRPREPAAARFRNARYTRVKLLMHDGFGVLCAARRLNQGRFA
ncbi:IS66 family insertion sequence element accessory protein TnpB [Cupriavidus oxalaticus]|uniref:Transposase n=1 Tax=Cupriavidus oxalaticus TaxID=96344 RepID=A0A4P7LRB0_9BURK|nr:hypothetical protein E0W60_34615 [Cupriavidus oxalaticus]